MVASSVRHLPLAAAVRAHVLPGSTVYIGNFGAQLYGVADELIRQRFTDLEVICGSGGMLLDKLIGAGVARGVLFAHLWNPVGPRPAWNLRRAAESGQPEVQIRELSLGMMAMAFQAAAWQLPFLPVNLSTETGYWSEDWSDGLLGEAECEFGSSPVVRALRPDVAFLHVDTADRLGNAVLTTAHGEHLAAAKAAAVTVVVAEQVVEPGQLPAHADLPGVHVDAVVEAPGSADPDGVPGRYPRRVDAYVAYAELTRQPDRFAAELDELRSQA